MVFNRKHDAERRHSKSRKRRKDSRECSIKRQRFSDERRYDSNNDRNLKYDKKYREDRNSNRFHNRNDDYRNVSRLKNTGNRSNRRSSSRKDRRKSKSYRNRRSRDKKHRKRSRDRFNRDKRRDKSCESYRRRSKSKDEKKNEDKEISKLNHLKCNLSRIRKRFKSLSSSSEVAIEMIPAEMIPLPPNESQKKEVDEIHFEEEKKDVNQMTWSYLRQLESTLLKMKCALGGANAPETVERKEENFDDIKSRRTRSKSMESFKSGSGDSYYLSLSDLVAPGSHVPSCSENSTGDNKPIIPSISWDCSNNKSSSVCKPIKIRCTCSTPLPQEDGSVSSCQVACAYSTCALAQFHVQCNPHTCQNELMCHNTHDWKQMTPQLDIQFDFKRSRWKFKSRIRFVARQLVFPLHISSTTPPTQPSSHLIVYDTPYTCFQPHTLPCHPLNFLLTQSNNHLTPNVSIEKWLDEKGNCQLGVFAMMNIEKGEDFILQVSETNRVQLFQAWSDCEIDPESTSWIKCLCRYLIHETYDSEELHHIVTLILDHDSDSVYTQLFIAGIHVVLLLVLNRCSDRSVRVINALSNLFHKLSQTEACQQHRTSQLQLCDEFEMMPLLFSGVLGEDHVISAIFQGTNEAEAVTDDDNVHMLLSCRLPVFWRRKLVSHNKVLFYNIVSRVSQWDMPVYPWESGSEYCDVLSQYIYDYNEATQHPISHDEIQQMYVSLNKAYELKQKKLQIKDHTKLQHKIQLKKMAFKSKISAVVGEVLRPHKSPQCTQGRIQNEDDYKYLINKLSDAILHKELKTLGDRADWLRVSDMVESKTRTYVTTYMESRGSVYVRHNKHTHHTIPLHPTLE